MTSRPTSVSSELQLQLVVPGTSSLPVRAGLRYERSDPYAVQVSFHTGGSEDPVEWTFARQLLGDGVVLASGEGDVRVWPSVGDHETVVFLSLSSPSGQALFEVPLEALSDFLAQTYAAVPIGSESEHVDVGAELALLLSVEPGA